MSLADKVQQLVINEASVQNYFESRNNDEHLNIKNPSEYIPQVVAYFNNEVESGKTLPWSSTYDKWMLRSGETTLITGWSGAGKSLSGRSGVAASKKGNWIAPAAQRRIAQAILVCAG